MSQSPAKPNWSFKFLQTMVAIMVLSPLVGALAYLLVGPLIGGDTEPLDLALRGAKTFGLIGGFAAPLLALGLVVRTINQQAQSPESVESGHSES